jgi:DNA-binding GntR family transcriptional regulator
MIRYRVAMHIDPGSSEYPYVQLAGLLRERIADGTYRRRLPSIMQLTATTGLSPGTVRRAIHLLVGEDLLVTRPGLGTFVVAERGK